MTVDATEPIIKYPYTGPGDYSFPFVIFDDEDIQIVYTDSEGLTTLLQLGFDYSVTFDPDIDGGICRITWEATTGYIDIRRVLPVVQETDWVNNDPFNAEILEDDLDKIVMILQQMTVTVEVGSGTTNWRGDWVTDFSYTIKDLVAGPNTNLYTCVISHLSTDFDNDLAAGYWQLVVDVEAIEAARLDAEESAAEAAESASEAVDSANTAGSHAADAELSANQAAASEATAGASETNAANCAADAAESADGINGSSTEAYHWANMGEDVPVPESLNPPEYSAYHWKKKGETAASGGITDLTGTAPVTIIHTSATEKIVTLDAEDDRFVPLGGTAGQRLTKVDGADRNVQWETPDAIPDVSQMAKLNETNDFTIQQRFPEVGPNSVSGTIGWNLSTQQVAAITLIGDTTITLSNLEAGGTYILRVIQDATGGRTLTWPASVLWDENGEPAINNGANKTTIYTFYSDGTNLYGQLQWREG